MGGGAAISTQRGGAAQAVQDAADVDLDGWPELKAILRIRAFRRMWAVLGLSALGDWLGLLATSLFAANQVSTSAAKGLAFGGVISVNLLPALVLGPFAGVLADRWDRRWTIVVCDVVRFFLFASIPIVGLFSGGGPTAVAWTAIATFMIGTVGLIWMPAKEAAVPNLLPRARLEKANQLGLVTTYGIAPVLAALLLAFLTRSLGTLYAPSVRHWANPIDIALYFNAITFLAIAIVVALGIPEISGRGNDGQQRQPSMLRQFIDGWKYVSHTPFVRGLVLGILGAFAGGGVVVGAAKFYALSLGGGEATFSLLFGVLFAGLGVGITLGPRLIGDLSRRRWFGMSIILSAAATGLLALAPHLSIAVFGVAVVGAGAGMAFLSGVTLLGGEVDDDMRGRVFAFISSATRVVLMLAIAFSGILVGAGSSHRFQFGAVAFSVSATRLMLVIASVVGVITGVMAFRAMDDRAGVPVLGDLWAALSRRPYRLGEPAGGGLFVVFEGGEGGGKSTQARLLTDWLTSIGRATVQTREPGATPAGVQIRSLLLDGTELSPRAEALLYAADRAHHVATVVRPALARGEVVISDRYIDSSIAYQSGGRALPADDIGWLSRWATSGLRPDLVVLLDVDPLVGLKRTADRGTPDRLESESLIFHERVRYAFLDLAAAEPARYLVLDAGAEPEETAVQIRQRVARLLGLPAETLVERAPIVEPATAH